MYEGELGAKEEINATDQKFVFYLDDNRNYYDFEEDKIDIYLDHDRYEYDQYGNSTRKHTKYDISRCDLSDFDNTDFEKNFEKKWDLLKPHCIKDPNKTLSLLGTENNEEYHQSWSNFSIMITRCTNKSNNAEISKC